jgi:hypothetical protein
VAARILAVRHGATASGDHHWTNVFDELSAPIANYYRRETIDDWLRSAGFRESRVTHTNDMSWTLHRVRS